ncbi:MAG TPA: dihydroorotase, partial [Solirubrobacterales bacterium]|nr:dihydroorotase [Solirubrobacterales bacterium]
AARPHADRGARLMAQARGISALDWRGAEAVPERDLLLRDVHVLDPRTGLDEHRDIVIRDGEIAELAAPGVGEIAEGETVDGEGLSAFPAFFDPHVHLRTPGREDEEDLETGTRAAAAGGFCGILAMANTDPPVDTAAGIAALREEARERAAIPTGFFACVTRGMGGSELTEMAELADAGAVGFSDDGLPISNARVMRRALSYQHLAGLPIALHEEDPELSAGGSVHEGEVSAALGIAGIPSVSESTMIARDAQLAAYEDARIHVQHLSAAESVAAVEAAKAAGVALTCEATPHHLTLTEAALRSLDAEFKMNPPLRSEPDRQALIEGLRSGTIDCIATDHAPHSPDEKEVPIEEAAFGVIGLETAFPVIYTDLVVPGVLDLGLVVERLSGGAEPLGFSAPQIEPGAEANVVLVDTNAEWEAGAEGWESRSDNSCFAGRKLRGRVLMTVAAGRVAYRQRSFALGVAQ